MTICEVQKSWEILDHLDIVMPTGLKLISHEFYDQEYTVGLLPVDEINQGGLSKILSFSGILSSLFWAIQLLLFADKKTVILANGSTLVGDFLCLCNYYLFFNRRTILYWDSHLETNTKFKDYIARRCFMGCCLATVWSGKQVTTYANKYNLPSNKFIYIPYKSNHSKQPPRELISLDFIFSGGNGKRDYKMLVDAVRGTNIPVIISATNSDVLDSIDDLPNVIKLSATEPAFSKLMAASRFVVIPMISTGLKGGGEANFCNAMWHKKAVIAVDNMSADDYIVEGETGYVVPPGHVKLLREKILYLWENKEKAVNMGVKGHELVYKKFTQVQGIRRLVKLACLLGLEVQLHRE